MDKEIIIDGVDVSGCEYACNTAFGKNGCKHHMMKNIYCFKNPNCYYKQLQRKTTECEELKKKLNEYEKAGGVLDEGEAWYGLAKRYGQSLDEIEEICRQLLDDNYIRSVAQSLIDIIREAKENN